MTVRCNHCMSLFSEEAIRIDDNEEEHCPICDKGDALMDMEEEAP